MKKNLCLLILMVMIACHPEDATPTTPDHSSNIDTLNATLLRQGRFIGVNHSADGIASIYETNGYKVVLFDPFTSQNGPDLKVYLSKDEKAGNYIRLGQLKSTNGNQSYAIPDGTDISQYGFVHIWCEKYSVEFARAELK